MIKPITSMLEFMDHIAISDISEGVMNRKSFTGSVGDSCQKRVTKVMES